MDQNDNQFPGDDAYIIEDTGDSVEEIEREMREAAQEAVAEEEPQPIPH
jgi:predicted RNase H-like HicB family nuclease